MTRPPEWLPWVPAVVLGVFAAAVLVRVVVEIVRYVRAGRLVRPMWRRAWRIRMTGPRTARRVGLVHTERVSPPWWSPAKPGTNATTRTVVPAVRVQADRWGVHVKASTVGRLGLVEFQNAARHIADARRVPTVRVAQPKAGVVRLRALAVDPLTEPLEWTDDELAGDVATWVVGIDQDGQPVTIRTADVSGVVVAGLAGYGKTVFLNARSGGATFTDVKTHRSARRISIPQECVTSLRWYHRRQQQDRRDAGDTWRNLGLVFTRSTGGPLDAAYVHRNHHTLCDITGVRKIRFHDLRHSAASLLLERGVELIVVKDLLGHAQINTTADIYAHVRLRLQRQAIEAMGQALNDPDDEDDGDGDADDPPILVPA